MKKLPQRFLLLCLLLVAILRLPSLFEPYWYGDEGVYLTLGQAIRKGLVLYRDIHDNKPPLLYLLAALSGNVFWFRAILLGWMLTTTILFWKLIKNLFPKQEKLAEISLFTFSILSSIPLIEGNIANAEIFMIGTTIAGFYLYFIAKKWSQYLLAGIFFSLSVLFKVPAVFDFATILVFFLFIAKKKNYQLLITNYFFLIFGFIIPILITIIYFTSRNALSYYLNAAFSQNLGYLFSWRAGTMVARGLSSKIGLISRSGVLLVTTLLIFLLRKSLAKPFILITIWFLFSLFAAALSERPYPHYLIQVLPSFCLILGILLTSGRTVIKRLAFSLIVLLVAGLVVVQFWVYPVFGYYFNFLGFATHLKARAEYFAWFSPQVNQTYAVANFLVKHTQPDERIFIWGDEPYIYALSRRLPTGRYTVAYHIVDYNGYQETIETLTKNPPRWIIVMEEENRLFPGLFNFLNSNYLLEEKINSAKIFHRRSIIEID